VLTSESAPVPKRELLLAMGFDQIAHEQLPNAMRQTIEEPDGEKVSAFLHKALEKWMNAVVCVCTMLLESPECLALNRIGEHSIESFSAMIRSNGKPSHLR
jgi:hypothetical protein